MGTEIRGSKLTLPKFLPEKVMISEPGCLIRQNRSGDPRGRRLGGFDSLLHRTQMRNVNKFGCDDRG